MAWPYSEAWGSRNTTEIAYIAHSLIHAAEERGASSSWGGIGPSPAIEDFDGFATERYGEIAQSLISFLSGTTSGVPAAYATWQWTLSDGSPYSGADAMDDVLAELDGATFSFTRWQDTMFWVSVREALKKLRYRHYVATGGGSLVSQDGFTDYGLWSVDEPANMDRSRGVVLYQIEEGSLPTAQELWDDLVYQMGVDWAFISGFPETERYNIIYCIADPLYLSMSNNRNQVTITATFRKADFEDYCGIPSAASVSNNSVVIDYETYTTIADDITGSLGGETVTILGSNITTPPYAREESGQITMPNVIGEDFYDWSFAVPSLPSPQVISMVDFPEIYCGISEIELTQELDVDMNPSYSYQA